MKYYPVSLHDALPISEQIGADGVHLLAALEGADAPAGLKEMESVQVHRLPPRRDRKSTRLNSSHVRISSAVFCMKKKITSKAPKHLQFKLLTTYIRKT